MADLSPTAQAVLDAFLVGWQDEPMAQDRQCLAAALRAAADQVVPEEPEGGMAPRWIRQSIRRQLLAIAAELKTSATENQ